MNRQLSVLETTVHCRAGSLEKMQGHQRGSGYVHCRAGSLENHGNTLHGAVTVHCRAGSLEKGRQALMPWKWRRCHTESTSNNLSQIFTASI